jgi:hypothetical protein
MGKTIDDIRAKLLMDVNDMTLAAAEKAREEIDLLLKDHAQAWHPVQHDVLLHFRFWAGSWYAAANALEKQLEAQGQVIADYKRGTFALQDQNEIYMKEIARLKRENEELARAIHTVDSMNAQLSAKVDELKRGKKHEA